ncbi:MAG: hypothetical protein JJU41_13075 [Bacteroidetes bacterium]|nr:hypothetical protein [Bacteroidota bacterium]
MKAIYTASLFALLVIAFPFSSVNAQSSGVSFGWTDDHETYGLLHRPFRMSLLPGISTNGTDATRYSARFSINLIAGYNGGLEDGYELGIVNINKYYTHARFQLGAVNVSGGRLAGINLAAAANYAGTDVQGLQLAGGVNIARNNMEGVQLSGLGNIAGANMRGFQYSSLMNIAGEDIEGIQVGGMINAGRGDMSGIQIASIINFSGNDMEGIQLSGVGNLALQDASGLQVSGLFSAAGRDIEGLNVTGGMMVAGRDASGLLVSGLGLVAGDDIEGLVVSGLGTIGGGDISGLTVSGLLTIGKTIEGLSVAGFSNIAQDITGLSVAGFANISTSATGLQIAPFNYAQHFEGLPIGFISWYGNGRKNIDIWGDELGFLNFGVKTGTREIYNMISLGIKSVGNGNEAAQLGWHLGRIQPLDEAWNRPALENYFVKRGWSATLMVDDDSAIETLNQQYAYSYLLGRTLGNRFSVYAGPSFNMLITNHPNRDDFTPYTIFETSRGNTDYRFWVGFTAGVQIF